MLRWATMLTMLGSMIACGAPSVDARTKSPLEGSWSFFADQALDANGKVLAADSNVSGSLIYTPEGRVSVQILYKSGRPVVSTARDSAPIDVGLGRIQWTLEEARRTIDTYDAYFGTYAVDSAQGIVTHRTDGELRPTPERAVYVRRYAFHGNELWLTPTDTSLHWRAIWRRAP